MDDEVVIDWFAKEAANDECNKLFDGIKSGGDAVEVRLLISGLLLLLASDHASFILFISFPFPSSARVYLAFLSLHSLWSY